MLLQDRDKDLISSEDMARIEENSDVLIGKPILRGTRISVTQVLQTLAGDGSIDSTLKTLKRIDPEIVMQDVLAAIRFAAVVCDRQLPETFGWRTAESGKERGKIVPVE